MKTIYFITIFFFNFFFIYGQHPRIKFAINKSDLSENPELIPSEYYFSSELTPIDEVQFPLNTMHQGKNYNKIEFNQPSLDSSYIYIYMNESRFGYRSLFKLVIGKANSNEKMILY
ncbi:hypothetical protein, partial [Flavobacterium sp.]|uniref:hypothetical protein n=1 Tax=Flavobacterium sp. TaxID=239 RepID=UPI0025C09488